MPFSIHYRFIFPFIHWPQSLKEQKFCSMIKKKPKQTVNWRFSIKMSLHPLPVIMAPYTAHIRDLLSTQSQPQTSEIQAWKKMMQTYVFSFSACPWKVKYVVIIWFRWRRMWNESDHYMLTVKGNWTVLRIPRWNPPRAQQTSDFFLFKYSLQPQWDQY